MESGSLQVPAESSLDFGFAFDDAIFSDRTLRVKIMPDESKPDHDWALTPNRKHCCRDQDSNVDAVVQSSGNSSSSDYTATRVKTIRISSVILAAKSPFFYKLFSNGMSESNAQLVTLQIQESEEAAFMDMLKFMYTNTLSSTTPSALLNVLIAADKYEVASCMKYCIPLLPKSPMTCELALLYLDLPSTILMDNTVRLLTDVAKKFLVARFNDIKEQMLNLSLAGIEIVLSSDDLQVDSEDAIYDFVMKWAQRHYTSPDERQEMLNTRILRLIRFPFMSCNKLKELLKCTDINPKHSPDLIFEALSLLRQRSLVSHEKERAYKHRPVKVTRFDSPREECVVYLDLKREECQRLYFSKSIRSQYFDLGGQTFYLHGKCHVDNEPSHSFGFFLHMQEKGSLGVEYEFSSRRKPSEEFVVSIKGDYDFAKPLGYGCPNLFGVTWDKFIAENSPYFINGVLHLRAVIKIKK